MSDSTTTEGAGSMPGAAAAASAAAANPESNPPLTPPTPEELESLRARAAKADEHWDRLLRMSADFENFKKRAARERDETRKSATEGVITRILGVVDNFEMAIQATNQPNISVDTLKAGVTMIHNQLRSVLGEMGLEEVNAAGQQFDPAVHEAVSQQETDSVPDGQVLQQIRKGYRLRDRLLRPASVVVARKPAADAAQS